MSSTITLDLSDEMRSALDEVSRAEGVPESEIVKRALKRHLFMRRFGELRAETLALMQKAGQGDLSDEDVFRQIP